MIKVAVTGGIGSGKSSVIEAAELFYKSNLRIKFLNGVDEMVKQLYTNQEFLKFLQSTFNTTDKAEISKIVFSDPNKRSLIETKSSSYIFTLLKSKFFLAQQLGADVCVVEFPLLFEMEKTELFDKIVLVTADEETRLTRACLRDNKSAQEVRKIMDAQLPEDLKIANSDLVIMNNGEHGPSGAEVEFIMFLNKLLGV